MEKIKIKLDYKCFPVWIYNDSNELVTNDLPEHLIGDETIDPLFVGIQRTYDNLFVDDKTDFKFVGFTSVEEKNKFLDRIIYAYNLLKEKVKNDTTVEVDIEYIKKIVRLMCNNFISVRTGGIWKDMVNYGAFVCCIIK